MNSHNELSQKEYYQLFHRSCFPKGNDWQLELEIDWLNQLDGEYRAKAIKEITKALERFEFGLQNRIIMSAKYLLKKEAMPLLEKGLQHEKDRIKKGDSHSKYHYGTNSCLATTLYELSKDERYISDIIESVKKNPFRAFNDVLNLFSIPTSTDTIDSAWKRLDFEKDKITRDVCLEYLSKRLDEPVMQEYLHMLPVNEGKSMLSKINEYRNQIKEQIKRQRDFEKLVQSYCESGMSIQQALIIIKKASKK